MDKIAVQILEMLPEVDKLWIRAIYERNKKNIEVSERSLIVELTNLLPKEFSTERLYHRLFADNSKRIELSAIGKYLAGNDDSDLQLMDKIMRHLKDQVKTNPELSEWNSNGIASALNVKPIAIVRVLKGSLYGSGILSGYTQDKEGLLSFEIDKNYYLQQLLQYNGLEDLLTNFLNSIPRHYDYPTSSNFENVKSEKINDWSVFKSKIEIVDKRLVFVLMPFTENWSDDVYEELIFKNVKALGLQCLRADSMLGTIVLEDVWIKINQAGLIIADVTGLNPNVMYELGIAHALHKKVILLTQEIENAPFDVKHLRHFIYKIDMKTSITYGRKFQDAISQVYQDLYPGLLDLE